MCSVLCISSIWSLAASQTQALHQMYLHSNFLRFACWTNGTTLVLAFLSPLPHLVLLHPCFTVTSRGNRRDYSLLQQRLCFELAWSWSGWLLASTGFAFPVSLAIIYGPVIISNFRNSYPYKRRFSPFTQLLAYITQLTLIAHRILASNFMSACVLCTIWTPCYRS